MPVSGVRAVPHILQRMSLPIVLGAIRYLDYIPTLLPTEGRVDIICWANNIRSLTITSNSPEARVLTSPGVEPSSTHNSSNYYLHTVPRRKAGINEYTNHIQPSADHSFIY
jgi:hypothetical protein